MMNNGRDIEVNRAAYVARVVLAKLLIADYRPQKLSTRKNCLQSHFVGSYRVKSFAVDS